MMADQQQQQHQLHVHQQQHQQQEPVTSTSQQQQLAAAAQRLAIGVFQQSGDLTVVSQREHYAAQLEEKAARLSEAQRRMAQVAAAVEARAERTAEGVAACGAAQVEADEVGARLFASGRCAAALSDAVGSLLDAPAMTPVVSAAAATITGANATDLLPQQQQQQQQQPSADRPPPTSTPISAEATFAVARAMCGGVTGVDFATMTDAFNDCARDVDRATASLTEVPQHQLRVLGSPAHATADDDTDGASGALTETAPAAGASMGDNEELEGDSSSPSTNDTRFRAAPFALPLRLVHGVVNVVRDMQRTGTVAAASALLRDAVVVCGRSADSSATCKGNHDGVPAFSVGIDLTSGGCSVSPSMSLLLGHFHGPSGLQCGGNEAWKAPSAFANFTDKTPFGSEGFHADMAGSIVAASMAYGGGKSTPATPSGPTLWEVLRTLAGRANAASSTTTDCSRRDAGVHGGCLAFSAAAAEDEADDGPCAVWRRWLQRALQLLAPRVTSLDVEVDPPSPGDVTGFLNESAKLFRHFRAALPSDSDSTGTDTTAGPPSVISTVAPQSLPTPVATPRSALMSARLGDLSPIDAGTAKNSPCRDTFIRENIAQLAALRHRGSAAVDGAAAATRQADEDAARAAACDLRAAEAATEAESLEKAIAALALDSNRSAIEARQNALHDRMATTAASVAASEAATRRQLREAAQATAHAAAFLGGGRGELYLLLQDDDAAPAGPALAAISTTTNTTSTDTTATTATATSTDDGSLLSVSAGLLTERADAPIVNGDAAAPVPRLSDATASTRVVSKRCPSSPATLSGTNAPSSVPRGSTELASERLSCDSGPSASAAMPVGRGSTPVSNSSVVWPRIVSAGVAAGVFPAHLSTTAGTSVLHAGNIVIPRLCLDRLIDGRVSGSARGAAADAQGAREESPSPRPCGEPREAAMNIRGRMMGMLDHVSLHPLDAEGRFKYALRDDGDGNHHDREADWLRHSNARARASSRDDSTQHTEQSEEEGSGHAEKSGSAGRKLYRPRAPVVTLTLPRLLMPSPRSYRDHELGVDGAATCFSAAGNVARALVLSARGSAGVRPALSLGRLIEEGQTARSMAHAHYRESCRYAQAVRSGMKKLAMAMSLCEEVEAGVALVAQTLSSAQADFSRLQMEMPLPPKRRTPRSSATR